tara:strand:- start:472 stop:714 length:243 start_codon:yes stop_codon:yes gene_type:complete
MTTLKAIKKENKNGTFTYALENGEVILKNTKKNYNAFALSYYTNTKDLNRISLSSKGIETVISAALKIGFKMEEFFTAKV